MRLLWGLVLGLGLGLVCSGLSQIETQTAATNADLSWDLASTNSTVITSRRLTFDSNQRVAVFEDNVQVVDPQLNLVADLLQVTFDKDNKVSVIEAEGNVAISQTGKTATGQKARYDVKKGQVVLTGSPRVIQGKDTLAADKITLDRKTGKVICEPNARLIITPDGGVRSGNLFKE